MESQKITHAFNYSKQIIFSEREREREMWSRANCNYTLLAS